jgi:putative ABC transport system permease protein
VNFALTTLWHDRWRFLPGMLAVAFSALLILLQWGLLLGLFSLTSVPIDRAGADVWVGHSSVVSVDLGRPIPDQWEGRLASQPEVERTEGYLMSIVMLDKQSKRSELCTVIGVRLDEDSLGAPVSLAPALRRQLTELGSVAIDPADTTRLGLARDGDTAEISNRRVRVVGHLPAGNLRSLGTPYLLCSVETARYLIAGLARDETIFILGRCRSPEDAQAVARRLRQCYPEMAAYTAGELAEMTRLHWLTESKAGIAAGWTALLGLVVGLAITAQTLYSAMLAARREFAVLDALGIPRRRLAGAVLVQSFWVGVIGLVLAVPAAYGLAGLADRLGARVLLPPGLVLVACAATLAMAMVSGLIALRSLRFVEPAQLLR